MGNVLEPNTFHVCALGYEPARCELIGVICLYNRTTYPIARAIAAAARRAGFDGVIYRSYSSLLRTGGVPFETVLGMSQRRFPQAAEYERAKIIPNLAVFGRETTGFVEV